MRSAPLALRIGLAVACAATLASTDASTSADAQASTDTQVSTDARPSTDAQASTDLQATPSIASHPRQLVYPATSWRPPRAADTRLQLAGGAQAFVVEDSTLPLIDIVVVARAGKDREPANQRGLAELTAALLRRGGAGSRGPEEFDQRVDELGAVMRSQSTPLYGAATLRVTREALADGVALLMDMIETPRFDPQRTASIKRNMLSGMSRRTLDPIAVLDREWDWLLFGTEHFAMKPLREEDLAALTAESLARFHHNHWRPENLVFAVAGDIDRQRLNELLDPRLLAWHERLAAPPPAEWPPPGPVGAGRSGLFHLAADIPQAKVALGHRAHSQLPTPEERVRLEVLHELLGGGGSIARLNGRLRSAEGLVYRVNVRLDPGDFWPADYRIFFDTADRNTPRAVSATLDELARIRSAPPHPEELAVAKRELLSGQFQAYDTAEEAAGYLAQDWLVGRATRYRDDYRTLVEAVSPEDVLATARRHLTPDRLTVLVVGRWDAARGTLGTDGVSELERLVGATVEHLPQRDPLSLRPVEQSP